MDRRLNSDGSPAYVELVDQSQSPLQGPAAPLIQLPDMEKEFAGVQFDADAYDAVMVASFGGVRRRIDDRDGTPQSVHPCFCFLLCIPVFVLQMHLIIFLQLDIEKTKPVMASDVRNPTMLFAGKVLTVVVLQLILFDRSCRSLKSIFLLLNPATWTDIKRIEAQDKLVMFTRPIFLAPFPVAALICKTVVSVYVAVVSTSAVLVCENATSCILNTLAIIFISGLDENWWNFCATVHDFEDIRSFQFQLYDPEQRNKERHASLFRCCLNDRPDCTIGLVLSRLCMLVFYLWQAFAIAFAIDTNILPVSRDTCAMWRLINGHSEYCISPIFFKWSLVHLFPMVDISGMITQSADPQYNGYCNHKYDEMQLRDITNLARKYPSLAMAYGCFILIVLILPHVCWYLHGRRNPSRHQSRDSLLVARHEIGEVQTEEVRIDTTINLQAKQEERLQSLEKYFQHLESDLQDVRAAVTAEVVKEFSVVKADIAKLRNEFREEATRGATFQKELEEFQNQWLDVFQPDVQDKIKDAQNKIKDVQDKIELFAQQVKDVQLQLTTFVLSIKTDLHDVRAHGQCSDDRFLHVDTAMTATQVPGQPHAFKVVSPCSTEHADAKLKSASSLSDEDLNMTQPINAPSEESRGGEQPEVISMSSTPARPEVAKREVTITPMQDTQMLDLNITRLPTHADELHFTVPPGVAITPLQEPQTKDLNISRRYSDDLLFTVPPVGYVPTSAPKSMDMSHMVPRSLDLCTSTSPMENTIPPAGWSAAAVSGGRSRISYDSDSQAASQLISVMQDMKDMKQEMRELRECYAQVRTGPQNFPLGTEAKHITLVRQDVDVQNLTTAAKASSAEPSFRPNPLRFVQPFTAQSLPDEMGSGSAYQEMASPRIHPHAPSRPYSHTPSSSASEPLTKRGNSVQVGGHTVVLPPRMQTVGPPPRMRNVSPGNCTSVTTSPAVSDFNGPLLQCVDRDRPSPAQPRPQISFRTPIGPHGVPPFPGGVIAQNAVLHQPALPLSARPAAISTGLVAPRVRSRSAQPALQVVRLES